MNNRYKLSQAVLNYFIISAAAAATTTNIATHDRYIIAIKNTRDRVY